MDERTTSLIDARSVSQADTAYDAIQHLIVTGELAAHQLVSESELCRALGQGRTPVREALQRLRFEGFVEVLPRRGILVTGVDVAGQLELLETRRPLEALMVELACRRADTDERQRMRALADDLESAIAAGGRGRYLDINRRIHQLEAKAAKNRYLKNQMDVIHNLSRRFWYSFISDTASFAEAAALHAGTLRAIADDDTRRALACNGELLQLLERVSRAAIDDRSMC